MPLQKQCAHFLLEVEPDQFCISLSDPNRTPLKWPKPSVCSSIHPTSSRLILHFSYRFHIDFGMQQSVGMELLLASAIFRHSELSGRICRLP